MHNLPSAGRFFEAFVFQSYYEKSVDLKNQINTFKNHN